MSARGKAESTNMRDDAARLTPDDVSMATKLVESRKRTTVSMDFPLDNAPSMSHCSMSFC